MLSRGPSVHLSWRELSCKDGTPYPEQWRSSRASVLAVEFEAIRAKVGGPIRVTSGYRSPTHNRRVGGAKASQHLEGRALDLVAIAPCTAAKLREAIEERAAEPGSAIGGIGVYADGSSHIDTRPRKKGRIYRWDRRG